MARDGAVPPVSADPQVVTGNVLGGIVPCTRGGVIANGVIVATVILSAPSWDVGPAFGIVPVLAVLALLAVRRAGRSGPAWWRRGLSHMGCIVAYAITMGLGVAAVVVGERPGTYWVNLGAAAGSIVVTLIAIYPRRTGRRR